MENNVYNLIRGLILSSALSLVAICNPVVATEPADEVQQEQLVALEQEVQQEEATAVSLMEEVQGEEVLEVVSSEAAIEVQEVSAPAETIAAPVETTSLWQEFHSAPGKCSLSFPSQPEHINEKMSLSEEGYDLTYDAYISSVDKQTVFMLLVAQYPEFVDESYAQMSLEGFLNGILSHNPGNQLIFADLVLIDGHSGLDFFIRTGNVYFKGRAIMVKNNLYLMAMECAIQSYDETHYNHFVNSFQLAH